MENTVQPEKKDRRTKKTRQVLRGALLMLLKEKRYEDISVQDIIERADVARSTFYVHYVDKDDLLTGSHGVFAENLEHDLSAHPNRHPEMFSTLAWFYHMQAQREILKVIAKDSALDLAMKTLRGIIYRSVEAGMKSHNFAVSTSVPPSLVADYLTDTLMTVIKWWFKDGMKHTPEQMDEIFQRLAMPGILGMVHEGENGSHY
jgi:AcrR family transcriptional regulator